MEGSEFTRICSKRGVEENIEARSEEDCDVQEGVDKKHKSSESRKHFDVEEVDEQDSGWMKASDDRNDSKKRSGGASIITDGDEDDYSVRSDSYSKIPQRNMDERIEKRSGENYRDRESNGSRRRRDDGNDWDCSRKPSSKASTQDKSDNENRNKVESSYDVENEKLHERDSRYPESKDSGKGTKVPGQNEHIQHRRWDEVEMVIKRTDEDSHTGRSDTRVRQASDSNKHDFLMDIETDFINESGESKIKVMDASDENGTRSSNRDDRESGSERGGSWKRLEVLDEENRVITSVHHESRSNAVRDDRQIKVSDSVTGSTEDAEQDPHRYSSKQQCEKGDKQRQEIDSDRGNHDEVETWYKSTSMDGDDHSQMRGTSAGNTNRYERPCNPERTARRYREFEEHARGFSDSDNEKSLNIKGSLTDKNWEREIFKDHRKRVKGRQDPIDGDEFDQVKEWEMPIH